MISSRIGPNTEETNTISGNAVMIFIIRCVFSDSGLTPNKFISIEAAIDCANKARKTPATAHPIDAATDAFGRLRSVVFGTVRKISSTMTRQRVNAMTDQTPVNVS